MFIWSGVEHLCTLPLMPVWPIVSCTLADAFMVLWPKAAAYCIIGITEIMFILYLFIKYKY